MLTIVKDSIQSTLTKTYDFKELRFEDETDEYYYYEGVDFIGNHVWVKVVIDDEVSLWD